MAPRLSVVVLCLISMPCVAADPTATEKLLRQPASVMDITMAVLSQELTGMAHSEFEALGNRTDNTRFLPHQVFAYYLREPSGKHIHIVATYRHADSGLTKEKIDGMCTRMIHWVRFHLGLHDDGSPLTRLDDVHASTMHQFVASSTLEFRDAGKLASELDEQTMVYGNIGYVGGGAGSTGLCKNPLRGEEKK